MRYRKDSLGQKYKFKQVVIDPNAIAMRKRKAPTPAAAARVSDEDEIYNSADEVPAAESRSHSTNNKRRRTSTVVSTSDPNKRSDIYALLN